MRRACLLVLLFLPLASAIGQDPAGAAARAAIDKLSWIEGDWRGSAWMQLGPNRRNAYQTERIYRAAGGTVLVIHGIGRAADPGVPANTIVHDAFGVITWDAAARQYRVRTHVANGFSVESVVDLGDRRMTWGFEHPQGGKVRYTITLTPAGDWLEIGERSADQGATWMKFMESNLKRVPLKP